MRRCALDERAVRNSEVVMPNNIKTGDQSLERWQEKMDPDFHPRYPRTGVEEVESLLDDSAIPEVFLKETERFTDIVIRFSATSKKLRKRVRAIYFTPTFTIEKAFDEVLRGVPGENDQRMMRAQLTHAASKAYRAVWLHVFTTLYLHQFHPKSNDYLHTVIDRLKKALKAQEGRSKDSPTDRTNLMSKYESMVPIADLFHRTATEVVRKHLPANARDNVEEITKEIWKKTRRNLSRSLYGPRAAELIFSGAAFKDMAVSNPAVSLAQPSGWQPAELALTLLNLDEVKRYKMFRGKLRAVRRKNNAKR
jgi:hypothetical protein